jgi:hypothetical protein
VCEGSTASLLSSSRSGVVRMHAHCQATVWQARDPPGIAPGCNFRPRQLFRPRAAGVRGSAENGYPLTAVDKTALKLSNRGDQP